MTLPCIWSGFLTLYQCPGNRGDLENNWVNRWNSRNYPCSEDHLPGALHLQLELLQLDAGYVRIPITLTVEDIKKISAVLQTESASCVVDLSAPCTSPRSVCTATGCVYQPLTGNLPGLLISMQNYLGPDKKGIETVLFMCEDDVKVFLKVNGERSAALRKLVQNRAPQRKKYHQ